MRKMMKKKTRSRVLEKISSKHGMRDQYKFSKEIYYFKSME